MAASPTSSQTLTGNQSEGSAAQSLQGSFAFLVHSQDTLPLNLPPCVDNEPLARQKRRRTSPEDQAVLETEYQRNPKPDKAARMLIVARVALGEKEVQIWFQNRRQNTRRKSRPLLPHELHPPHRSSSNAGSLEGRDWTVSTDSAQPCERPADPSSSQDSSSKAKHSISPPATAIHTSPSFPCSGESMSAQALADGSRLRRTSLPDIASSQQSSLSFSSTSSSFQLQPLSDDQAAGKGLSQADEHVGYISNRRHAAVPVDSSSASSSPNDSAVAARKPGLLRRTSSVRLSMSLEGKARVISGDDSPPRIQPPIPSPSVSHPRTFHKSVSSLGFEERVDGNDTQSIRADRRPSSGRSRDSRAWEFYCDADARNSLSAKAEQEQTGSAVGIIGLLRARSTNAMMSNKLKHRLQSPLAEVSKRLKTVTKRPGLARASSSLARLQSQADCEGKNKDLPKSSSTPQKSSLASPTGESDKENCDPEDLCPVQQRKRLPHAHTNRQKSRAVLKENSAVPSHSAGGLGYGSDVGATLKTTPAFASRADIFEDPQVDQETRTDQNANTTNVNIPGSGAEDDFDCVQNLLSLSQGAWR